MHLAKCREDYMLRWNDSGQLHVQHWTADATNAVPSATKNHVDKHHLWRYSTVNLTSTPSLSSHPPGQTCQHWSCREDPVHHDKSSKRWAVWKVVSGQHIDWCPEAHFADVVSCIENPHGTWKWMKTMICNSGISVSRGHVFRQHSWSQLMVTHLRFIPMESWDSLKLAYCSAMTSNAPTVSFLRTMWEETQATKRIAFEGAGSLKHHFSCNNAKIK